MIWEQTGFWGPGCTSTCKTDCYGGGCPDAGTGCCKRFYNLPERTTTTTKGGTHADKKDKEKNGR